MTRVPRPTSSGVRWGRDGADGGQSHQRARGVERPVLFLEITRELDRLPHPGGLVGEQLRLDAHAAVVHHPLPRPALDGCWRDRHALLVAHHAADAAADRFEVRGGRVERHLEQGGLVGGIGDAGQRAHLGEGEARLRERAVDRRQVAERARDPDLLPRGVGREADAPREPVRVRGGAVDRPEGGGLELADQGELTPGRVLEVGRELGELGLPRLDRAHRSRCGAANMGRLRRFEHRVGHDRRTSARAAD